jgi:hypothetical protein
MVIRALADLSVTCVLPKTFLAPLLRGINPVAMLASANKHFGPITVSANLVVRLRNVNKEKVKYL